MPTNSEPSSKKLAPTAASTSTSHSAACTTFFVVTTRIAPNVASTAITPKAMFCATMPMASLRASPALGCRRRAGARDADSAEPSPGSLSAALLRELADLDLGARLVRLVLRDGVHPLDEALLVVEQLSDAGLRVLVLRAPEDRVERA